MFIVFVPFSVSTCVYSSFVAVAAVSYLSFADEKMFKVTKNSGCRCKM